MKKSKCIYIVIEHRTDIFNGRKYDAYNKKYKQKKRAFDYAKSIPVETKIIKVSTDSNIKLNINL